MSNKYFANNIIDCDFEEVALLQTTLTSLTSATVVHRCRIFLSGPGDTTRYEITDVGCDGD